MVFRTNTYERTKARRRASLLSEVGCSEVLAGELGIVNAARANSHAADTGAGGVQKWQVKTNGDSRLSFRKDDILRGAAAHDVIWSCSPS
jgi:hypothetical protein